MNCSPNDALAVSSTPVMLTQLPPSLDEDYRHANGSESSGQGLSIWLLSIWHVEYMATISDTGLDATFC